MSELHELLRELRERDSDLAAKIELAIDQHRPPRLYTLKQFERVYQQSRSQTYEEIKAGRLRAIKRGRRTYISHEAAERWLASLPAMGGSQ